MLDDFYLNLINIWKYGGENGSEGGWAGYYYGVFSDIIKDNDFKKCAEVGIGYGFHAKEILDNTKVEKLYLIDPMKYYENDSFATDVINYGGFEKLVKNIKYHLNNYENRYEWFRKSSLDITNNEIEDESLDAVFIDGDHSYFGVKNDYEISKNSGKIFVFHDIVNDVCLGVVHFWNELKTNEKDTYDFYEFTEQYEDVRLNTGQTFLGIGVAIKK
jgi:hypothetical protein